MKYRLYSIVNQYIAGIHAGIQTAHAVHEMFCKYPQGKDSATNILWEWAVKDKTIIVLDGGYQSNLERIYSLMEWNAELPYARFYESEDALNGALTAIAIVLPEFIYAPQYATNSITTLPAFGAVRTNLGPEIADCYKDLDTGQIIHWYNEPEKDLIAAIKGLRLKGA